MSRKLKIATIGGGSSYTPELIEGFINRADKLPIGEIHLVDVPAGQEKLEIVGALARRMIAKAGLEIKVELTTDRRQAIDGADFVTTQFRVGGIDARVKDELIPLKYGVIGQETTGPGGFAKALRSIAVIIDVCRDIEQLSPNAWLINFANPSGIITETVLKHTKVKALGLCNVPITMVKSVAQILNVDMKRVYIQFAGLNHLVWGLKILLDGENVTTTVLEKIIRGDVPTMKNIPVVEWPADLIKSLNMLPCPYHHYFYNTDKMLAKIQEAAAGDGCRGQVIKKLEAELFELYKNPDLAIKPPQLEQRGGDMYSWAACELISSLYNNTRDMQVVNVRNNGAIADLPDNVAIETNCMIDRDGAHPLALGHMPPKIRGLLQAVKAYEELTIECGVNGDYAAGIMALASNPLVPSFEIAKQLLDEILIAHKPYLPQFRNS